MKMTGEELVEFLRQSVYKDRITFSKGHQTIFEGLTVFTDEDYEVPTAKVKVPAWFDEWYKSKFINFYPENTMDIVENIATNNIENHTTSSTEQIRFIKAILNGYEVEQEKLYRIPLPNLKTSDGYQQYLSRRSKRNGHWFASRRQSNLIQAFTKAEIEQVPDAYKQYAVEVEADAK